MDLSLRILIVDDSSTMRKILTNMLKKIGFTNISVAVNGKTALEKLKNGKFDLVFCDWNMPGMLGIDLLKIIRSDNELKDLPFVMVTAEAMKDNIIQAVKAGVTSYIEKPFSAETVSQELNRILGR
ncbi:MAG: response regulator [Desulfobacteraceae bacterium]|nr:response regulator [Desulfobacteraceae bacterium]